MIAIGVEPNGKNINDGVGSTAPTLLCETVVASGAAIGIALDGDADRLIVVDENGKVVDGDQLMATIADRLGAARAAEGRWAGYDGHVQPRPRAASWPRQGLGMIRTGVGDRYVLEAMRAQGYNVGGEQSGHIILSDYATTGDGLVAALQVLAELVDLGAPGQRIAPPLRPRAATPAQRPLRRRQAARGRRGQGGRSPTPRRNWPAPAASSSAPRAPNR